MSFKDKYSVTAEKDKSGADKIVISVDAFAIGELLEELLEKLRLSFNG